MKIRRATALACASILVAGCAHEEHRAQYDESISPSANQSGQYNSGQTVTYGNGMAAGTQSESDKTLVSQVRQSLQQDPQTAPAVPNIQITANKGLVVLSGTVQSGEQKRQIESIVAGLSGVDILDDQLRVSSAAMNPTSRPDAGSHIYSNAGAKTNGEADNQPANPTTSSGDNSVNNAAPSDTSTNSPPRIYNDAAGNMNASTNNALSPTSRTNGENQIYQQSQDQNAQGVNTNGNNKIP